MKALRLSLLSAFLGSSAALAAPVSANLAGGYQALLYTQADDAGAPVGSVALTLSTKSSVSGKLTLEDKKVYAFKTTLDFSEGVASHDPEITIKRGKDKSDVKLQLKIRDGEADTLEAILTDTAAVPALSGSTLNGFKVKTYGKTEAAPTVGSYSISLELANDPTAGTPAGSGYAIAKGDAKGVVKITGKTGDGTAFTASAPNSANNQFIVFANPYKRDGSFLAGKITLTSANGSFHMAVNAGVDFQWKKTSTDKDKSYRTSFGPLEIIASAEPWAPGKGVTVKSYLKLALGKSIPVAFSGGIPDTHRPLEISIDDKNNIVILKGATGAPDKDGWSKIFKGKVDIKSGKFTISIILADKRKVTIEGVFKVPAIMGEATFSLAPGFVLIPPVDKTGTITSEAVEFQGPPVLDPAFLEFAATAGTYIAPMERITNEVGPIKVPYVGGTPEPFTGVDIEFTISPDLESVNFDGRIVPLSSKGTGELIYSDATKSPLNNLTLIMFLDGAKRVYNIGIAQYSKGRASSRYIMQDDAVITKLP